MVWLLPSDNRHHRRARQRARRRGPECPGDVGVATTRNKKPGARVFGRARQSSVSLARWVRDFAGCGGGGWCRRGQQRKPPGSRRRRHTGASKLYLEDLREEFVRDFVFPMMRANAVYESYYLLGTSIARPKIAKLVEIVTPRALTRSATERPARATTRYALRLPRARVESGWPRGAIRNGRFAAAPICRLRRREKIPVPVTAEKPH